MHRAASAEKRLLSYRSAEKLRIRSNTGRTILSFAFETFYGVPSFHRLSAVRLLYMSTRSGGSTSFSFAAPAALTVSSAVASSPEEGSGMMMVEDQSSVTTWGVVTPRDGGRA